MLKDVPDYAKTYHDHPAALVKAAYEEGGTASERQLADRHRLVHDIATRGVVYAFGNWIRWRVWGHPLWPHAKRWGNRFSWPESYHSMAVDRRLSPYARPATKTLHWLYEDPSRG